MHRQTDFGFENLNSKRLLTMKEAMFYTGMGRTACRNFADKIGATRKMGVRVLIDRPTLDKALDELGK